MWRHWPRSIQLFATIEHIQISAQNESNFKAALNTFLPGSTTGHNT